MVMLHHYSIAMVTLHHYSIAVATHHPSQTPDSTIVSLDSIVTQSPLTEIRPLVMKAKRKKVSRPAPSKLAPSLTTLDGFLE
ncbi:hypothetical protein NFI96_003264 [Prochilodus magdalenae]|nr:hypothetical protein NFI96_003264 [Prochilodus magdalenae]